MAKPTTITLQNQSGRTPVHVLLSSLYDGSTVGRATAVAPGQTAAVPVAAGAAILTVHTGRGVQGARVWSGAVPASATAPVAIFPDQKRVAYRGRDLQNVRILEHFKRLDSGGPGVSASTQLGIVVATVLGLALLYFAWHSAQRRKRK